MERTRYYNNTEPTEVQLNHTEDSRVRSTLRRQRSSCQLGVVRGFRVNVNAVTPTQIDIGPGEGYTGGHYRQINILGENSSERISTITDTSSGVSDNPYTALGINLASYGINDNNYVNLVYSETTEAPLSSIFYPFTQYDTVYRESYQVSVLTEADWNALTLEQRRQRIFERQ